MALAPTLAQSVKPHEDRRRPDRTLPVGKHHWWGHVLPRPRSTTPAISSKLKLFRRFLLRRTHLAFVCFLFLAVWSSTCRNLDHRQQRRHFLVDWPCHFVTFPHHHFRGDLRNRLHPWYLLPLFVRPLMARLLSVRRALAESPPFHSTSFALAAQHIKLTKIQHSYAWVWICCIEMNFMKSEIRYKRTHCDRPYSQNSWNSTIIERPYCRKVLIVKAKKGMCPWRTQYMSLEKAVGLAWPSFQQLDQGLRSLISISAVWWTSRPLSSLVKI